MEKVYRVQINNNGMPNFSTAKELTGEWELRIIDDDSCKWTRKRYYCSACGSWQTYGKTDYCPDCGAKMKGEEDEIN